MIFKLFFRVFGFSIFGLCANGDTPLGFRPTGRDYGCNPYTVLSTYATAIKEGSPIKPVAGGYVELAASTNTGLLGVAANAIAASTGGTLWVYDHPLQHFIIQDDASATLDISVQNANMDFSTESSTTDQSNVELIATAITADGQCRVLYPAKTRYPDGTENAVGDNCDWIVMINEHARKATAGI